MPDLLMQRLRQHCSDLQSVLDSALSSSLEATGTGVGHVQVMDWETGCLAIEAQRGFKDEFLYFLRRVTAETGTACGRALRERHAIVVEDVLRDRGYAPYREVALGAGYRAVQSTPLISSSGAFVGVLSTHFPAAHRPLDSEMQALKVLGELTANAISCLYTSANEVIREALRLLGEQDRVRAANLVSLRQDIQAWLTSGPATAWDAEQIKQIRFRATRN